MAGSFHDAATRIQAAPPFPVASQCLGRDREVARLCQALQHSLLQGQARAALLYGPRGIGKRRVGLEVASRLHGLMPGLRVLEVSSAQGESQRSLRLLEMLLRSRFHQELDSASPTRALVGTMRKLVPTHEVVELTFTVASLVDAPLPNGGATLESLRALLRDPVARVPFLADTMHRLLMRDAQGGPLLLLLQRCDLADTESRNILTEALKALQAQGTAVALVALQMDDRDLVQPVSLPVPSGNWNQSRRQTWERLQALVGTGQDSEATLILGREDPTDHLGGSPEPSFWGLPCEVVGLAPLDDLGMESLIRNTLAPVRPLPDALVKMLVTGLGGMPAQLEPTLAALVSHQVLEAQGDGQWHVQLGRLSGEDLPAELEGLSLSRLGSLPAKHRGILEQASVIGMQFRVSEVLALLRLEQESPEPFFEERSQARLERVLLDVQGWDLVEYLPEQSSRGDEVFAFRFEQERDLLYHSLEPERRQKLHRVLARLLEFRGSPAEQRVAHWVAGQAPRRAALARLRAGLEAQAASKAHEAINFLEQALETLDLDEGEPFLQGLVALGQSALVLGDFLRVESCCVRLAQAAYVLDRALYGARAWLVRAQADRRRGDLEGAVGSLERALGLVRRQEDSRSRELQAEILDELSMARWQHGAHYSEALELAEQARSIRTQMGDVGGTAQTLLNMVQLHFARGKRQEALRCCQEAESLARAEGKRQLVARARNAMGVLSMTAGDYDAAEAHWQHALALSRELGDRGLRAAALSNLGELALLRQQPEPARDYLERAVKLSRSIGELSASAESLRHLSQIALSQGQIEQAVELGRETLLESRRSGSRIKEGLALRNLGELWHQVARRNAEGGQVQQRSLAEAERCLLASIKLLEAMGNQIDLRLSLESYAAFLKDQGRGAEEAQIRARLRASVQA